MEEIGVCHAVDGGICCDGEENHRGNVVEAMRISMSGGGQQAGKMGGRTYRLLIRGIIAPLVIVSTRSKNGIMESTL